MSDNNSSFLHSKLFVFDFDEFPLTKSFVDEKICFDITYNLFWFDKNDCHDMTEILLKVLNTITITTAWRRTNTDIRTIDSLLYGLDLCSI
jgi:hypothetical protein